METEHASFELLCEMTTHDDLIVTIEELEAVETGSILTLLPWNALFWLLATVMALRSTAESERWLKSTDWFELHHERANDISAPSPSDRVVHSQSGEKKRLETSEPHAVLKKSA
jgi:hypothetical protein